MINHSHYLICYVCLQKLINNLLNLIFYIFFQYLDDALLFETHSSSHNFFINLINIYCVSVYYKIYYFVNYRKLISIINYNNLILKF